MNQKVITILLSMSGGVACGFVLATMIDAAGFLLFDQPIGMIYLPILMAVVFAGIAAAKVSKKPIKGDFRHDK